MELVRGMPITDYCEQNKLGLRQRLELFIPVCQAIQHAHQKGVIHRDIKPSNILVTMHDGQPVPKVIDFGVAKAIGQRLTEHTMYTQYGQMIGTLEYMSPEQAEMSGLDVDTRSDIYSLGVLVYELLTGTTPLARERIKTAGFDEVRRLIREEEPARPSTRLSNSLTTGQTTGDQRHQPTVQKVTSMLGRELDWIAMKALEKDRTRRYDTAAALAADVQRFLDNEPVEASPPSTVYRLRKFLRRNRAAVGTVALFVLLLLSAAVVSTWQAVRATSAQRMAEAAQQEADRHREEAESQRQRVEALLVTEAAAKQQAVEALQQADTERAIAQAVNQFINVDILQKASPLHRRGDHDQELSLRTVLDQAAKDIGHRFPDQPLVEAEIRLTIGQSYSALGEYDEAEKHLLRARELREEQLGGESAETLLAANKLVENYLTARLFDEAEIWTAPVHETAIRALGERDRISLAATRHLALLMRGQAKSSDAERLLIELLELCRDELGDKDSLTAEVASSLAAIYLDHKRLVKARALLEEVVATRREVLGEEHPSTLLVRTNLGMLYGEQRDYKKAHREIRKVLQQLERILGPDHPYTLQIERNMVWWLMKGHDFADLEEVRAEAMAEQGPTHEHTLMVTMMLGNGYTGAGNPEKGAHLLASTLELCQSEFGDDAEMTIEAKHWLAQSYSNMVDYARAEPLLADVFEYRLKTYGVGDRRTEWSLGPLNQVCLAQKKYDVAIARAQDYLDRCRAEFGSEHENTGRAITILSGCYVSYDPEQRRRLLVDALRIFRDSLGIDHGDSRHTLGALAGLLLDQGKYVEAEPLIREDLSILRRNQVGGSSVPMTYLGLAESSAGQAKFDAADESIERACQLLEELTEALHASDLETIRNQLDRVVAHYRTAGRTQQAELWCERIDRLVSLPTSNSPNP